MIRVQDLHAGYRSGFRRTWREVLQGVSFNVPRGSITGYLGVNGAGKTTTIKVLVGINAPSGGTVTIADKPVRQAQHLLGYFPEAPFFYDGLSARELLAFYGDLSGRPAQDSDALLERVGLGHAMDQPVRGYSKGMRQRLGLAQALVHDPELLILDEPLDGLDPMGRLHLRTLIAEQAAQGRTVFFSSHVLSDVEAVCDHLVLLDGGKVTYDGPTRELTAQADARVEVEFELEQELSAEVTGSSETERHGDGSRRVICPDQSAADRTIAAVVAGQGRVLAVRQHRPSLEEYFLARFSDQTAEASS